MAGVRVYCGSRLRQQPISVAKVPSDFPAAVRAGKVINFGCGLMMRAQMGTRRKELPRDAEADVADGTTGVRTRPIARQVRVRQKCRPDLLDGLTDLDFPPERSTPFEDRVNENSVSDRTSKLVRRFGAP